MADSDWSTLEVDPFFRGLRVVFSHPDASSSGGGTALPTTGTVEQRPEWVERTAGLIDAVAEALPSPEDETGTGEADGTKAPR